MKKILASFVFFIPILLLGQNEVKKYNCHNDSIIRMVHISSPNSVGGVDVGINWRNYCDKTVKYIRFTLTPYNAVDDAVYCTVTNKSTITLKDTGPFITGYQTSPNAGAAWSDVWYNYDISYCILKKVSIQYMDGSIKEFNNLKIKSSDDILLFFDMLRQRSSNKVKQ